MIRVRLPGGVVSPAQWLAVDKISDEHGNSTFKITTRQTFQFHGIIKSHLKPAMQSINKALMDTIGACGDVSECFYSTINHEVPLTQQRRPRNSVYSEPIVITYTRRGLRILERFIGTSASSDISVS